jgi:DNA-binding transcriptional MerR regulator/methylmalonyl-CoA mutase cobalamin-binding subunit
MAPREVAQGAQGLYRIAAVSEQTGVHETTLRAWERRYGIPTPRRTESRYRLYSEKDIRLVREMQRLCSEGMAAAEAARSLLAGAAGRAGARGAEEAAESPFAVAMQGILSAVARFDEAALDLQLRRLMFLGPATELLDRVLAPTLTAIGDRWHAGELSVAQEHFATEKLGTLMRDLLRLIRGSAANNGVVLACFADDEHDLGLLGLAMRFAEWGLRPLLLGARTPPPAVSSAVEATSPTLVALSVTLTPPRARARELIGEYAQACGGVPWIVGGAGVGPIADLVEKAGGTVLKGRGPEIDRALRPLVQGLPSRRASGVSP